MVLYWFRNDLRLNDNPGLVRALASGEDVLPVYIFDTRCWQADEWGHIKTGSYRTQFLLESVRDLQTQLEEAGGQLVIRTGLPEAILPELADEWNASNVFAQAEYTREEVDLEEAVARQLKLHLEHGSTLFHPEDVPMAVEDIPDIFTEFRKACEKRAKVRPIVELPEDVHFADAPACSVPKLEDFGLEHAAADPRAALAFKGGSQAGWDRIDHYFWNTEALSEYKHTRNGLIGPDYSAKLSPWLANGSLSPREIYWEVQHYEQEVVKNQSTYWLIFELIWRDYFKFVALKYGDRIFWPSGIKARLKRGLKHARKLEKWIHGETGDAFVDANMRELMHTGWMSNRGRQNVASYLVHDMGLDWRQGASWFESALLDYDPASNYGNWIYVAGVGNDPRPNRKFNTARQAEMYDKEGAFRELWLGVEQV